MSSARLRARVGGARPHGHAILPAHEHQFSKPGADGTGKGHVAPHAYRRVHGVLYDVTAHQLERLTQFEGGYQRTIIPVQLPNSAAVLQAVTFLALRPGDAPPPSLEYLDHYRDGFLEHALPRDYARAVLLDAGDERPL